MNILPKIKCQQSLDVTRILLGLIEFCFKVKIYPFHINSSLIASNEIKLLMQEVRALATLSFNHVPEYQCFLENPAELKNKLIVIHRDKDGSLNAFSSSVIMTSKAVRSVLHLGLFLVSPYHRHKCLQFKLGVVSIITYLITTPIRYRYWITNVSSVLGTLSTTDRMYCHVYPGYKKKNPDPIHIKIADEFQDGASARCLLSPDSVFDRKKFIYLQANKDNCFLKKTSDKRFYSFNETYNTFYKNLANFDEGDAILQIGYATHYRAVIALFAYLYRIVAKGVTCYFKIRREHA